MRHRLLHVRPTHVWLLWSTNIALLLIVVVSGLLMGLYYEPSAAIATSAEAEPLTLVRARAAIRVDGVAYDRGDLLAVPLAQLDSSRRAALAPVLDATTGRPLRPTRAWQSLHRTIEREVTFGRLVRSMHAWGAGLLIAGMLLQGLTAIHRRGWQGKWKWWSASVVMAILLAAAFTGSLLPWDGLALMGAQIAGGFPSAAVPFVGDTIASVIRGGMTIGGATLTRTYALHASWLPLALVASLALLIRVSPGIASDAPEERLRRLSLLSVGIGLTLLLTALVGGVQTFAPLLQIGLIVASLGLGRLLGGMAAKGNPTAGDRPWIDLLPILLVVGGLLTLALLAPWNRPLEGALPIDPSLPPQPTGTALHPEWFFMVPYGLLTILPSSWALVAMVVMAGGILALPLIDRGTDAGRTRIATLVAWGIVAVALAITLIAYGLLA